MRESAAGVRVQRKQRTPADEELLKKVHEGDPGAFDMIVKRYKMRLLNFVFRFVGDRDQAEELVQETFLRVFRERKNHERISNFSTWIFTIAGNLAKSELRRRKRWRFFSLDQPESEEGTEFEIPDESQRPDDLTHDRMIERAVEEAMETLSPKYREAVILRDIQGFAYEEIAEIIGCPVGTVKSRVNRARLRLQEELKEWMEGIQ
ncbi:MAG: sigma-70 family RNA polymerase sigma factor [Gemmatimonadota bacterium]|nr:MAG: sigma-70 family RNA polymerase sigma factor [Gemmatimonadota bacterium]